MSDALAALPWVEPDSIKPSREKRQVRFTVTDRSKFSHDEAEKALSKAGYGGSTLLTGPTEQ